MNSKNVIDVRDPDSPFWSADYHPPKYGVKRNVISLFDINFSNIDDRSKMQFIVSLGFLTLGFMKLFTQIYKS